MPMVYQTGEKRDGADVEEFVLAALQWRRVNRASEGVVDARYWPCRASRPAVLVEFEPGANPVALPQGKESAEALSALVTLASNPD